MYLSSSIALSACGDVTFKSNDIELNGSSAGLLVVAEGTKGKVPKILDGILLYPDKFVSGSIDWLTDVAAAGIVEEVITEIL